MRIVVILLFVCISNICMAERVHVKTFGAIANDEIDDTKALRKALDYARANQGTTLLFEKGVYLIKDDKALDIERRALSGEFGDNIERKIFTPYFNYAKGLDFSGIKDLVWEAEDAMLLCEGWMEPLSIGDASNITIKGLTIDYIRKPFVTGVLKSIDNESFTIEVNKGRKIDNSMPLTRLTFWDKEIGRVDPYVIYNPKRRSINGNMVTFEGNPGTHLIGSDVNINHSMHFCPAIMIIRSNDVVLKDVTIHSQAGMGVVGFDSHNILMSGLSIKPSPGYTQSTNTDATHFAACTGLIRFENCYFQGQGDDATNVHGYYQSLTMVGDKRLRLTQENATFTHSLQTDVPRIGDQMEIVERKSLKPIGKIIVTNSFHKGTDTFSEIEFSGELPEGSLSDYYVMNISKLPNLEFENNMINSHLARGILVKTRGVKIVNNVFRYCTGTAIHIGAESGWWEGTHSQDVLVKNNIMIGCGSGSGGQGGASGIAVIIEASDTQGSYLHDNIRIENNHIIGENHSCGIFVGNAKNVVLKNNHVSNCQEVYKTHSVANLTIE